MKKIALSKEVVRLACAYTVEDDRNINRNLWANVGRAETVGASRNEAAATA